MVDLHGLKTKKDSTLLLLLVREKVPAYGGLAKTICTTNPKMELKCITRFLNILQQLEMDNWYLYKKTTQQIQKPIIGRS